MSQIKTLTATIIRKILSDDFKPGQLLATETGSAEDVAKARATVEAISINEIDDLIGRLEAVKELVNEQRNSKENKARELLESIIEHSEFSSIAELLAAYPHDPFNRVSSRPTKTTTASNKAFTVRWTINGKDNKKEEVSYVIQNNQPQGAILNDKFYQDAMKKMNNDVHEFQMTYSPEYAEAYKAKCNAKFDGVEFYINERGALNSKASEYFVQWLDTQSEDVQKLDDKKQKQLFKAAVMTKN